MAAGEETLGAVLKRARMAAGLSLRDVERRTGVRPTFGLEPVWAIVAPASEEMLAMTEEAKAAFLAAHETRPLRPDHWEWRGDAAGNATEVR